MHLNNIGYKSFTQTTITTVGSKYATQSSTFHLNNYKIAVNIFETLQESFSAFQDVLFYMRHYLSNFSTVPLLGTTQRHLLILLVPFGESLTRVAHPAIDIAYFMSA